MRDISEAVGILPGSLYAHIKSKEALLGEIVENGINAYLEALAPIAASDAPADARLRAAIKTFVQVVADNREQTIVALHQWKYLGPVGRRSVVKKRNAYEAMFKSIIDDGIRSGLFISPQRPRITLLAIMGMLNWMSEWFSVSGEASVDEVGDALADFILSGLRPRPPERLSAGAPERSRRRRQPAPH